MRTLYLRNVPDDLVERLEELARRDRASVTAVAIRELEESTRRVDNRALLDDLPDTLIPADAIVAALEEDRAVR